MNYFRLRLSRLYLEPDVLTCKNFLINGDPDKSRRSAMANYNLFSRRSLMKMPTLISVVLISLSMWISPVVVLGQSDQEFTDFNRAGKTTYNFLRVEQGARPVAMGGAFTAVADDINSIFYNPAGLTNLKSFEYLFSYSNWLVDSKMVSAAFGYKTDFGAFGLSIVHFGINAFEETLPLQPEGTGRMVSAGDLAVGLAFAKQITDLLSLGIHARYIQETLDLDTRTTFAFDISTLYNTGYRNITLGVALRNLGPDQAVSSTTKSESFSMPIDFNVTLASEILGSREDSYSLTVAVESGFTIDLGDRYRIGAELWVLNLVALRGGYRFNYSNEDFSFGVGISPEIRGKKLNIDFAYSNFINHFESPLRISISGTF